MVSAPVALTNARWRSLTGGGFGVVTSRWTAAQPAAALGHLPPSVGWERRQ